MSPTIIGGELRGRLHFQGVTITDSIGAGALARFGGYAQRAALAAQAGADLIICAVTNPATTPRPRESKRSTESPRRSPTIGLGVRWSSRPTNSSSPSVHSPD